MKASCKCRRPRSNSRRNASEGTPGPGDCCNPACPNTPATENHGRRFWWTSNFGCRSCVCNRGDGEGACGGPHAVDTWGLRFAARGSLFGLQTLANLLGVKFWVASPANGSSQITGSKITCSTKAAAMFSGLASLPGRRPRHRQTSWARKCRPRKRPLKAGH